MVCIECLSKLNFSVIDDTDTIEHGFPMKLSLQSSLTITGSLMMPITDIREENLEEKNTQSSSY